MLSQAIASFLTVGTTFGLKLLAAGAIFVGGRWGAKLGQRLVRRVMAKMDPTLSSFVGNVTYIAILAFATLAALGQLGVETASIVALVGAAGLAVGLALQGSLANFAAGILMIIFRPFKVGDWIMGADVSGIVEEIHIFTTSLRTLDNKGIIIPNGKLMNDNITNYSAKPSIRMDLVISVGYGADIDHVKAVLKKALAAEPRILHQPAPVIGVLELGESGVRFAVRPFVKPLDYWTVYFGAMEQIKKHLDAAGIEIPFPQRQIHLIQHSTQGGLQTAESLKEKDLGVPVLGQGLPNVEPELVKE